MKTQYIIAALRNATSPRARLAAWQSVPIFWGKPVSPLPRILRLMARTSHSVSPESMDTVRRRAIQSAGPELSSPDSPTPFLWVSPDSPEILAATPGRTHLDHRGWFTDEYQDETLETYAVTLTRFPRLTFYAVKDSCNGDLRVHLDEWEEIDFGECDSDYSADEARDESARAVIRSNDRTTESEAEDAVEYRRKDRVGCDISENKETLKTLRAEIRGLAHELKRLCPSPMASEYPAAGKALRDALKSLLRDRRELMATNSELAASL